MAFTADLAAFRRSHPVFRRHRFLTGAQTSEVGWFTPAGTPMTDGDWGDPSVLALCAARGPPLCFSARTHPREPAPGESR